MTKRFDKMERTHEDAIEKLQNVVDSVYDDRFKLIKIKKQLANMVKKQHLAVLLRCEKDIKCETADTDTDDDTDTDTDDDTDTDTDGN
jgi:hypothetical protein